MFFGQVVQDSGNEQLEILEPIRTTQGDQMSRKPSPDPSPAEIAAACLEIQTGWTPEERMRRLRPDLRPQFRLADQRRETMTANDYDLHHGGLTHAELT